MSKTQQRLEFIKLATQRDWSAFKEAVKRSSLGLKEPDVVRIEPVVNRGLAEEDGEPINCEHTWKLDPEDREPLGPTTASCDQPADVRIVRARSVEYDGLEPTDTPADVYSDTFCADCVGRALTDWVQTQVATITRDVDRRRDQGGEPDGA